MLARVKSVGANLFLAAFCLLWPIAMGAAWIPFGVFLGVFLWPVGIVFLYRAATLRVEEDLKSKPTAPERSVSVAVPVTDSVREDNRSALLRWVTEMHPRWPRSAHHEFSRFVADELGNQRWNGLSQAARFSGAVDSYLNDVQPNKVSVDLQPISSREQLGHVDLKKRMDSAPDTEETVHFRALASGPSINLLTSAEVGFVVIDEPQASDVTVLYELFVIPHLRGEGFGNAILRGVEDYAWAADRGRVRVIPRQIDPGSLTDAELAEWYLRRGYSVVDRHPTMLEKVVE